MGQSLFEAAFLGIIEGVTEFLPISSTGHLILFIDILKFQGPPGKVFEVFIQLGAVLAVCWVYRRKILDTVMHLHNQERARHFTFSVFLAFLPAVILGILAHDIIKEVLFNPFVVAISLIFGGAAILLVEWKKPTPMIHDIEAIPYRKALMIGILQTIAMIPGVSRSGATIMGAMCFGVDRKAATEFSFFLAIPTLLGAALYDLMKNTHSFHQEDIVMLAVGTVTAFVFALLVVRALIAFVGKHGFEPFAWYRIALGLLMLVLMSY